MIKAHYQHTLLFCHRWSVPQGRRHRRPSHAVRCCIRLHVLLRYHISRFFPSSFSICFTQFSKALVTKVCLEILRIKLEHSGSLGTSCSRESCAIYCLRCQTKTFAHPFLLTVCSAVTASVQRPGTPAKSRLCLLTHAGRPKLTPSSRAASRRWSAPTFTPLLAVRTGGCGRGAAGPTMGDAG
jgi:hypothetical protein